jgi:hypothetical protein
MRVSVVVCCHLAERLPVVLAGAASVGWRVYRRGRAVVSGEPGSDWTRT